MITAIDVGATKTLIAQFKTGREPLHEIKFPTPETPAEFIRVLRYHLSTYRHISAMAIGLPGQISQDGGTVLYCGNMPWRNVPIRQMLAESYGCPIYLENDAAMAALSEINSLSPVPTSGFYLAIGTGIGSAIIVNGKLMPGLNRSEAGHMLIHTGEAWQEWEDIASGRAVVAKFNKLAKDLDKPEQWQWLAEQLSFGLNPIITTLLPEAIVVGGGVGHYFDMFHPYLYEKLHRRLPEYLPMPSLHGAQHKEDAVLFGCYYRAKHADTH